jgi:hypothetical protein
MKAPDNYRAAYAHALRCAESLAAAATLKDTTVFANPASPTSSLTDAYFRGHVSSADTQFLLLAKALGYHVEKIEPEGGEA